MADQALSEQVDSDKPERACAWCGAAMSVAPTGRPKTYCSAKCGAASWRSRNPQKWRKIEARSIAKKKQVAEERKAELTVSPVRFGECKECGSTFRVTAWNRIFCSQDCKKSRWVKGNRHKCREYTKKWQEENKPHCASYARKRRAENPVKFAEMDREYRRRRAAEAAIAMLILPIEDAAHD